VRFRHQEQPRQLKEQTRAPLIYAVAVISVLFTGSIFLEGGSQEAAFQHAHPFFAGYYPGPFHTGILTAIPTVALVEASVVGFMATCMRKAAYLAGTVLAALSLALSVILWDNAWKIEGQVRYCFGTESCATHLGRAQIELTVAKYLLTLSLAISVASFLWFAAHRYSPLRVELETMQKRR
jgi:hypothetical protein